MNAKVRDLMTESVITVEPDATIDRVRRILQRNKVGALPVVDPDGQPVGIVSATDLVPSLEGDSLVSAIMTEKVYTVPKYDDVSVAARIMRNHKIHRLVVTHEQRVVGMITTFVPRVKPGNHMITAAFNALVSRFSAKKDTRSSREMRPPISNSVGTAPLPRSSIACRT
jgi:signal-transduction protein with cAMP-binding, CBS, and nucleotidyltransferase domain